MARIRSIHPSLFTDEAYMELSPTARCLLPGIWTECDDQGVFAWKPLTLKVRIMPADAVDMTALLFEMTRGNLVKKFTDDGKDYGAVRNFCKFQRPKKPVVVHPLPDDLRDYVAINKGAEESLRRRKHDEQEGHCFYCATAITYYSKRANSLEIDHRIPVSRGGTDDEDNLVAACRPCNRAKCDMTDAEFTEWRKTKSLSRPKTGDKNAKADLSRASGTSRNAKEEGMLQREDGGGTSEDEGSSSLRSQETREREHASLVSEVEVPPPAPILAVVASVPSPAPVEIRQAIERTAGNLIESTADIPAFLLRDPLEQFMRAGPWHSAIRSDVQKLLEERADVPLPDELVASATRYFADWAKKNTQRAKDKPAFAVSAATFIRKAMWNDYPPPERLPRSKERKHVWGGHPAVPKLIERLGEGVFDQMIAPTRLKIVDHKPPIILAPTALIRDILETKHWQALEWAFGIPVPVQLDAEAVAA